jgi:hypothetical protein
MSNIWKPAIFQGRGKYQDYFEGWYFKSVDRDEKTAFAIIPGLSLSKDKTKSHAFIMLVDARNQKLYYNEYPVADFVVNKKEFELKIGKNYFSLNRVHLDINDGINRINVDLKFRHIHPWPVTLLSPGTMGWYGFVPMMECYHATLSFNHAINGFFEINEQKLDFDGGKGYLEKDWGRSMPSSWIWLQTNHFNEPEVSLFGSIANIPWLSKHFTGFVFGFYYKGRIYRFATYTGAHIKKLDVANNRIEINIEDKKYSLKILASRTLGVDLPAPKLGEMTAKVNESLRSVIQVDLYQKTTNGQDILFSGVGRNAGLEFVGDISELLA